MVPGIYAVRFVSGSPSSNFGIGVVVVDGDTINGGDQSHLYKGQFTLQGDTMRASIEVSHYQGEGWSSIFGNIKHFKLTLEGKVSNEHNGFTLTGRIEGQPQHTIEIVGERKSGLIK